MKKMISRILNKLRFSKYDFVNHTVCACIFYLLLRIVLIFINLIVSVKPEYQAITAAALVILLAGQLLEIYQVESKTGAAQGSDSLAIITAAIACMVTDFVFAHVFNWYSIPGFDTLFSSIPIYIILALIYYFFVIRKIL
jgi:hypothetical protein